jgi:acyl-CoA thioester hydrolase
MRGPQDAYLDAKTLQEMNIPGDWRFGLRDFVRFSDVDAFKHVNNAVYMRWFETLRVLYLDGVGKEAGLASRPMTALRTASTSYDAPLYINDAYLVLGRISTVGRSSFGMEYAVWSGGEVKLTSSALLVTVDDAAKSSVPIPAKVRHIMLTRDGGVEK